jgi:hypothetical protein
MQSGFSEAGIVLFSMIEMKKGGFAHCYTCILHVVFEVGKTF